jgi:predicted DNA-binding transcriptional regulator AlpA
MGGFSRTTIDCLIASGVFPRLSVIGPQAVAWSQQELEDWITSKRQAACNADGWPAIAHHRQVSIAAVVGGVKDQIAVTGDLPLPFKAIDHFQHLG